jgi:lipid A disaccharide synthetase
LTCISSWYICIPNIIWIHQTITEEMKRNCHYHECDGRTSPYHSTSRFQRAYNKNQNQTKNKTKTKTRGSVSQQVWHDKDPSLLGASRRPILAEILQSLTGKGDILCEWKILAWDIE